MHSFVRKFRGSQSSPAAREHPPDASSGPHDTWSPRGTPPRLSRRSLRLAATTGASALATAAVVLLVFEATTSRLQAYFLGTRLAPALTFELRPEASSSIIFPDAGPYNERLGYTRIPGWIEHLQEAGYRVEGQAHVSPLFHRLASEGLFPVYREKVQAGLEILDRSESPIFRAVQPEWVYPDFDAVPAPVRETLLFIENRTLLDSRFPHRNPAVEWRRFARASFEFALLARLTDRSIPGASTLATQMEKFRHSPSGLTPDAREKLRQMASASIRTYLEGEQSMDARRRVVVDYLNSVPLAAIAGHGEVIGLGDGLRAWYGADPDEVSRLLNDPSPATPADPAKLEARATAYRQVLSLLLAQRRPSWYLVNDEGRRNLDRLVDVYLDLLTAHEIVPPELREAALAARPVLRDRAPERPQPTFVDRKAANSIRPALVGALRLSDLYELDRLDLTVRSTLDAAVQAEVTDVLTRLTDPSFVQAEGLRAPRLLLTGDPGQVRYAVSLFERGGEVDLVRVETDSFEGPLNLNRGTKLDLGSTAKLRTLVHYLEVMEELHRRYAGLSPEELRGLSIHPEHQLARWTVDFLTRRPGAELSEFLEAALDRRYSASSGERFFTGGGLHTFRNFDRAHEGQVLSVRSAFAHSVNLPFIRIMRDVVRHHVYSDADSAWAVLQNPDDPRREQYLERFADREGGQFMSAFYRRYPADEEERTPERILEAMIRDRSLPASRLAWAFRFVRPEGGVEELAAFLRGRSGGADPSAAAVQQLFDRSDPSGWGIADVGYLAGIHPLELEVARLLLEDPTATLVQVLEASEQARIESYRWLLRTRHRAAQDQRIRTLLEEDAFVAIHRAWARLGYPFDGLVPSYATAIGSSADRPEALAELVGIVLNEGLRRPVVRIRELHFAAGTPYETVLRAAPAPAGRVLGPEVAAAVGGALGLVVSDGTGRRLAGGIPLSSGSSVTVAGKTGTGNHTFKIFGAGGRLVEERPVSRTATFVFTAGDRFYGTVTAFVPGEESSAHTFTSSLPAQVLRMLGPALTPLLEPAESVPLSG